MPNKANLRRWVRALRSGAYEQGKSRMRSSNNKYCCLGVALDLALANGVRCSDPDWGQTSILPAEVNNWFGVKDLNGDIKKASSGYGTSPAILNDGGTSFVDIADRIEFTYNLLED
jgi:hypothetical protein